MAWPQCWFPATVWVGLSITVISHVLFRQLVSDREEVYIDSTNAIFPLHLYVIHSDHS